MDPVASPKDSDPPVRTNALEERLRVNLIEFIKESGYTASQVADLAGIAQASLGRYTRGENALQADVLKPLAEVFGRTIEDFYDREPPPPKPDLATKHPLFLRSRPGFEPTEEDLKDWDEFLDRVRSRRGTKPKRK